jgi:CheY-like chemotaxis protein
MPHYRTLIVDDAEDFRQFLRSTLREKTECEVVGEASDGPQAVAQAGQLQSVIPGTEHAHFSTVKPEKRQQQGNENVEQLVEQTWNRTGGNRVENWVSAYS